MAAHVVSTIYWVLWLFAGLERMMKLMYLRTLEL